jgi:hypothetical protein
VSATQLHYYVSPPGDGAVDRETLRALEAFGEPMLTDTRGLPGYEDQPPFRAWLRSHGGGRTMGHPATTPNLAAEALLRKIGGTQ